MRDHVGSGKAARKNQDSKFKHFNFNLMFSFSFKGTSTNPSPLKQQTFSVKGGGGCSLFR